MEHTLHPSRPRVQIHIFKIVPDLSPRNTPRRRCGTGGCRLLAAGGYFGLESMVMLARDELWNALNQEFDVLIIGAGIMGSGVAREAARRGLRVALLEQYDIANGTSSRSSKLVHGGLRYLEQLRFSLVFESVQERRILQRIAPHLVRPLAFLFPIYKGSKVKLWVLRLGMWLYDLLSWFSSPRMHRILSPRRVLAAEPVLKSDGLKGAPLYYDCSTDDARLTLETVLDAKAAGATVVTRCKVGAFQLDSSGRIIGAEVQDAHTQQRKAVSARIVINAAGPWLDAGLVQLTKGVHIAVPHAKLPLKQAITCFHPKDKRVMFAIPWGDLTYLGTTDTPYAEPPELVCADAADVDYLLATARDYFPAYPIATEIIMATWAGLRSLVQPKAKDPDRAPSSISREHEIKVANDGLVTVAGGKLTTYRRVAVQVVDTVAREFRKRGESISIARRSHTERHPLPGALDMGRVEQLVFELHRRVHGLLSLSTLGYLVDTYGSNATGITELCIADQNLCSPLLQGRPEILAQVHWAVEQEFATHLEDFFVRRTQLYYRDANHGLDALPTVTGCMATLLGWSPDQSARQQSEYRDFVALHQRWRQA